MKTRKRNALLLLAFVCSMNFWAQSTAGNVSVTVTNIKSTKGVVLIGLYKSEGDFLKNTYKGIKLEAKKGTVSATFDNLDPGIYAISLFHDENDNGKLDTNFIGIPKEPYAASNNAKGSFGPPKWEDAKFSVQADQVADQKIKL